MHSYLDRRIARMVTSEKGCTRKVSLGIHAVSTRAEAHIQVLSTQGSYRSYLPKAPTGLIYPRLIHRDCWHRKSSTSVLPFCPVPREHLMMAPSWSATRVRGNAWWWHSHDQLHEYGGTPDDDTLMVSYTNKASCVETSISSWNHSFT